MDTGRSAAGNVSSLPGASLSNATATSTVQRGRRRPNRSPGSGARTIGKKVGRLRQVTVNLTVEAREMLDDYAFDHGCSLGEAAMVAMRATHRSFRPAPVPVDDGFAPPRATPRALPSGPKRSTTLGITEAEAGALAELAELARLSVAHLVDRAVRLHFCG